jgi:hypothetical protein
MWKSASRKDAETQRKRGEWWMRGFAQGGVVVAELVGFPIRITIPTSAGAGNPKTSELPE